MTFEYLGDEKSVLSLGENIKNSKHKLSFGIRIWEPIPVDR